MPDQLIRAMFFAVLCPLSITAQSAAPKPLGPRSPADPLDGPPFVSAKAWIIVDMKNGNKVGGIQEAIARPMASTTKIMTALVVLRLAAKDTAVLDEIVTFSEAAAMMPGSSAKLVEGEKLPVRELLYGLLLPSGNDAARALAEHFGPRFGKQSKTEAVTQFVDEMNRQAVSLGLKEMSFKDPSGLSRENVTSARDLAALAREAFKDEQFRSYVGSRRHECEVVDASSAKRKVTWNNTNKLLEIDGYDGVKTGTTTPAGNCLVASGRRGDDHLLIVVLGSTATDGRYVDARNLFRWGWQEIGHKPVRR